MNYITSCTKCKTQFIVRDEHLEAYAGKVKCGHCEHVFNAKKRLTPISDNIHSPDEYQASLAAQHSSSNFHNTDFPSTQVFPADDIDSISEQINYPSEPDFVTPASPSAIEDITASSPFEMPARAKKPFSWGLFATALLLLLAAALQSIYFLRTSIAASYPQFRPILSQACAVLGCTVPLPQVLALITIDDSDMQENGDYTGVFNFTSKLNNKAYFSQTYPNIEITLTDTNDQPVLRRNITPKEYLPIDTDITAGMTANQEIAIQLPLSTVDIAVAGYRVQLTY
jgi:predicted Zn finger-like uncharacterized protein